MDQERSGHLTRPPVVHCLIARTPIVIGWRVWNCELLRPDVAAVRRMPERSVSAPAAAKCRHDDLVWIRGIYCYRCFTIIKRIGIR